MDENILELENDLENEEVKKLAKDIIYTIKDENHRIEKISKDLIAENNSETNNTNGMKVEDYKKLLKSKYDYIVNELEKLNNSRRVISFLHNINSTLKILERKYVNYNLNKNSEKLNLKWLIYIINYLKVFDNEIYTKILDYGSIDTFLDYEYKKIIFANKDKIIELSNEDIKLLTKNWYMKQVFDFEFKQRKSIFKDNIEVVRREQAKIIKDLFIDYNLEDDKVNLLSERELMVQRIITDKDIESDNSDIFKTLVAYKEAIVYCNSDKNNDNIIIKKFSNKCIKLVNERKITLLKYCELLPKRAYEDKDFIKVFCNKFLEDYDYNIKITHLDYKNIKDILIGSKNIIITEKQHIIIFSVMILANWEYTTTELKNKLEYFTDEQSLFKIIRDILNDQSDINSFEELLSKVENSSKDSHDIMDIKELISEIQELIEQINTINKMISKLEEIIKKEDKEKYVEDLSLEEQINYINELTGREDMYLQEARNFAYVVDTIYYIINYKKNNKDYQEFEKLSDELIENLKDINEIIKKDCKKKYFKDNNFNILPVSVRVQYICSNYRRIKKEDKTKTDQNNN